MSLCVCIIEDTIYKLESKNWLDGSRDITLLDSLKDYAYTFAMVIPESIIPIASFILATRITM